MTGVPLAWDVAVTLTASYQKIFSDDVKVGFFAQRDKYQTGIDAGKVLPPAKNMDEMHTVVTNATVDGALSALFALLIVIVLLDAARTCFKAISDPSSVRLSEVPWTESKIVAPAGLIPTAEERAELAAAGLDSGGGRTKEPVA